MTRTEFSDSRSSDPSSLLKGVPAWDSTVLRRRWAGAALPVADKVMGVQGRAHFGADVLAQPSAFSCGAQAITTLDYLNPADC
jgi:hypothetical protein